jgi:signal transduction histidine kinase/DNA-binding response OmpR family regulator
MKNKGATLEKIILLGIQLAAFSLILESVLETFVFDNKQIILPNLRDMRLTLACIIMIFTVYAQSTITKRRQTKENTDAAISAKNAFLANMSHEIRTPMNGIVGFTDMLMDTKLSSEQIDYAKTIKSAAEALLLLIDQILNISKIESGLLDLENIDFDPEVTAYDVCKLIKPKAVSKNIKIQFHIGNDVPACVGGDPARFRQVLLNLLGNAIKFTEFGEIELRVDVEDQQGSRVKLCASVRDTGIGISEDKTEEIFQIFQQADVSTTRNYGGTGLGLPISREIARKMGGDVWVESKLGEGSTFYFTTWLEKRECKQAKKFAPVSLSGKKVLIVDDNKNNLAILKHITESAGMRVVELLRGQDVLPAMQNAYEAGDPFDLCILDIQMPGVNGYDLAIEIRRPGSLIHRVALLAFSCSTEGGDGKKCLKAGFDGFLGKPIEKKTLLDMVERLLREEGQDEKKGETIITQYTIRGEAKQSARVLLAEDNPVNQKLAKIVLTKAGYQVDVVSNGKEAVDRYLTDPGAVDLIFMDIQMPEMDGVKATKIIRDNGFETIPIIAMTAHAMKGDREKCIQAGMDDYITKPIKRESMFEMLEKWVINKEAP